MSKNEILKLKMEMTFQRIQILDDFQMGRISKAEAQAQLDVLEEEYRERLRLSGGMASANQQIYIKNRHNSHDRRAVTREVKVLKVCSDTKRNPCYYIEHEGKVLFESDDASEVIQWAIDHLELKNGFR